MSGYFFIDDLSYSHFLLLLDQEWNIVYSFGLYCDFGHFTEVYRILFLRSKIIESQVNNWKIFVADARRDEPVISSELSDDFSMRVEGGSYLFEITRRMIYAYSYYEAFSYSDVRVDARIDSRNVNANKAGLICRYSEKEGWYEFSIANNGLYNIYFAKPNAQGLITYRRIADGGSNKVNVGNASNEYSIICQGNKLSLYINGDLIKQTSDDLSTLRSGKIGVSVTSANSLPVIVGYDWIEISEP